MFLPINLLKLSFKITLQMPNFALPLPIKWSVGKNKFNEDNPDEPLLAIQVPVESVTSLIEHLTNLVNTKQVSKKVMISHALCFIAKALMVIMDYTEAFHP